MADDYEKKVYSEFQLELAIRKLGIVGRNWGGRGTYHCPYHKDKTPSLIINYKTVGYHCFSGQCGRHGNIFQLVRDLTGKSMEEFLTVDTFDVLFNIRDENVIEEKKEEPVEIKGVILPWKLSPEAQAYTRGRGILDHIAESWNMGYLEDGEINGTRFYHRLTIPTTNKDGILINIEGRDTTGWEDTKKVIYPKNALKPIFEYWKLKSGPIFVQEGLVKLAALRGDPFFANSTATLGSYLSPYQEAQLKYLPGPFMVVLDNDESGEKFFKRIKELLTPMDKVVSYVRLKQIPGRKNIKDTDDIITKGLLSVKEYREAGFMEFGQTVF